MTRMKIVDLHQFQEFTDAWELTNGSAAHKPYTFASACIEHFCNETLIRSKRGEYFATGYTRDDLKAMHPAIELGAEWVKCPQCNRENSRETWNRFDGKCPNCRDIQAKTVFMAETGNID